MGWSIAFSRALEEKIFDFAQVWFDSSVQKNLGSIIDAWDMKYPKLLMFSDQKKEYKGMPERKRNETKQV